MSIIKPTVGRVLWYWPSTHDIEAGMFAYPGSDQPFTAQVVFVHSDRMINLLITDHGGGAHEKRSVTLLQAGDSVRDHAGYAEWMPYQQGQASKDAAGEKPTPASPTTLPVVDPGPDSMEREIQAKANKGPRVTPADIEANIASEHYFTAADGVIGQQAIKTIEDAWDIEAPTPLHLLTFCVLVLQNGFTVTGESACASPENFDAAIGRKIARENAVNKIWPLLGFRLRDELARPVLTEADALADLAGEPRPS